MAWLGQASRVRQASGEEVAAFCATRERTRSFIVSSTCAVLKARFGSEASRSVKAVAFERSSDANWAKEKVNGAARARLFFPANAFADYLGR